MAIYKVTLTDGQTFLMSANLAEASAPIWVDFHGEEDTWQSTPFQTADVRHRAKTAARMCAEYFAADSDDCTRVASVELA